MVPTFVPRPAACISTRPIPDFASLPPSEILTFKALAKYAGRFRGGKSPHLSACSRWRYPGVAGVPLPMWACGGTFVTTRAIFHQWMADVAAARSGQAAQRPGALPVAAPATPPPRKRRPRLEAAGIVDAPAGGAP